VHWSDHRHRGERDLVDDMTFVAGARLAGVESSWSRCAAIHFDRRTGRYGLRSSPHLLRQRSLQYISATIRWSRIGARVSEEVVRGRGARNEPTKPGTRCSPVLLLPCVGATRTSVCSPSPNCARLEAHELTRWDHRLQSESEDGRAPLHSHFATFFEPRRMLSVLLVTRVRAL